VTHITRSASHHYTYDGVTYPGATGVIGMLDKPALMAWASRMTAEAAIAMGDALPRMVAEIGPEAVLRALTARSAWKRDEAAALGSEVHRIADLIATGGDVPSLSEGAMRRVDNYTHWWATCGWKVRASEAMVVNRDLGYGGTLDLLAYDRDGRTVLADYKTGNRVYTDSCELQLCMYAMAEFLEVDGRLYGMPWPDRFSVIHVTDEGVSEVPIIVTERTREAVAALLAIHRWRKGLVAA
jgi:hypothetical protein